jgi:hypothetical protein
MSYYSEKRLNTTKFMRWHKSFPDSTAQLEIYEPISRNWVHYSQHHLCQSDESEYPEDIVEYRLSKIQLFKYQCVCAMYAAFNWKHSKEELLEKLYPEKKVIIARKLELSKGWNTYLYLKAIGYELDAISINK